MAVSALNTYTNASIYKWQNQKLSNNGNSSTPASSSSAASLFNNSSSMTSQVSGMVELTKYAMDAMGLDSNSRVTFSQITKYRNQLESEFNEGLKTGLANSGISDLNALTFALDSSGKISVSGSNAHDRQLAQNWLNSNPSFGETLASSVAKNGVQQDGPISFRLSVTGKMTVINNDSAKLQSFLNEKSEVLDKLRAALVDNELTEAYPLNLTFNETGELSVSPDTANADQINALLQQNGELSDALKTELEKNSISLSSVSFTLRPEGAMNGTVHNMDLQDAQAALDAVAMTGTQMANGLNDLGIDPNISFSIQVDDSGNITVISDHPDRDKLQQFFAENPDLVKKYRQIETLAGIDDARKAMQLSPNAMRKRIQIESMAAWWSSSSGSSSWFGTYNNGSLSMLSGLNINV